MPLPENDLTQLTRELDVIETVQFGAIHLCDNAALREFQEHHKRTLSDIQLEITRRIMAGVWTLGRK